MEQMRSFGYICSNCGKAQVHQRSRFALSAAAARMECECEKAALTVETDGVKFRLSVPCGLCGETHQAELDAQQLLEGRGVGLGCPKTRQICCYIGEEQQVMSSVEEMTMASSNVASSRAFCSWSMTSSWDARSAFVMTRSLNGASDASTCLATQASPEPTSAVASMR